MEIENIAIFDGYVLDTFPCDLFQGSTVKPGNHSFFLSTQTSEKKIEGTTSYKKSEIIPPLRTNKQTKTSSTKNMWGMFYGNIVGYVLVPPLKNHSSKKAQLGASPSQQSLWMFLLDLRQFDLEEMGWLLNYLTSVGANAQKGWQEGVNVLIRRSAWKASQNLFLHTHTIWIHLSSFIRILQAVGYFATGRFDNVLENATGTSFLPGRTQESWISTTMFWVGATGMGIGKQGLFLMEVIELIKPLVFLFFWVLPETNSKSLWK